MAYTFADLLVATEERNCHAVLKWQFLSDAGVAQLVEQLIRNQQVIGSSPIAGSSFSRQFSIHTST